MSMVVKFQSALFRCTRPFIYIFAKNGVDKILHNPKTVVITRLEDIGDMLVFIPALRTFRKGYPNAKITLITRSALGYGVIKKSPYLDRVILLENTFMGKFSLIRSLRKIKPDIFVISAQEFGKVKWGFWGKAKVIVGYRQAKLYNEYRKVKLRGFIQRFPSWDDSANEVWKNLKLASALGIGSLYPELEYTWIDSSEERFSNILVKNMRRRFTDFVVILAPFSKRESKEWDAANFAYLADWLIENLNSRVIINGAPNEQNKVDSILKLMKHDCFNAVGKVSLEQLPPLIKNCDLLVGVDSGPVHFAAALKVPYVAIFRPIEHEKWAHSYNPHIQKNIFKTPQCIPCPDFCKERLCIDSITVDEVLNTIKKMGMKGLLGRETKKLLQGRIIAV